MSGRIDSRSLALFLAVADAGSFRQAAERLHLSQPPLSRAIAIFEQRLGCRLFERRPDGVVLTPEGRALRPHALRVARQLAAAEQAVRAVATARPGAGAPLRIGLTTALELPWYGPLVTALGSTGAMPVDITYDTSPRLIRRLRSGHLDAACVAMPVEATGLERIEVDRLPMVVALATADPLSRRRRLGLADLAASSLFWFERSRQPAFYDYCQRVFDRHRFEPRRLREPADSHLLLAAVAAGDGFALLPASFAWLRRDGVSYRRLVEGDELAVAVDLALPPGRSGVRDRLLAAIGVAVRSAGRGHGRSLERAVRAERPERADYMPKR